ncbi:MAG: hypothetical protein IPK26_09260 [Planctomycetes bacterium]|nr:hypothetical protein [Planctomycetota bacterium]
MTDADVPVAVVRACIGPLSGLDQAAIEVTLPDGVVEKFCVRLPEAIRSQDQPAAFVVGDDAWQVMDGAAAPLPAERRERLLALRELAEVATLGPVRRCVVCTRVAATTFSLLQPDGRTYVMTLAAGSLLPDALAVGERSHRIQEFLDTPTTHVPSAIVAPELGSCRVKITLHDAGWPGDWFARPQVASTSTPSAAKATVQMPTERTVSSGQPRMPKIESVRALRWLCVADPGDWPTRAAVYRQHAEAVQAADQALAGFPAFFRDGDRDLMAIGFRAREGAEPYSAGAGIEVRELPAGRALVVFPRGEDFAACAANGSQLLQTAMAERKLTAAGPIVAQPYFHLQKEVPDADRLRSPTVRVSVLLQ